MSLRIILALGFGSLKDGFPHIVAEIKQSGITVYKFEGSLPPAPEVEKLHARWKMICGAVISTRTASGIKIKQTGITNISEDNPGAIYRGLNEAMSRWLASEDFYTGIERNLRKELRESGGCSASFEVFIESKDADIWELPWDAWKFREYYSNSEIIQSTSQYRKFPKKATSAGMPLPSRGRILCVWGNSQGINLKQDKKSIKKSVGDRCKKLKFLRHPKPEELRAHLEDEKNWQILYYGGHSNRNATHGWLHINQTDIDNTVTVDYLKKGLEKSIFKGLELLILNSCSSLGLAADLVAGGLPLPSTIVMRAPIPDAIAHYFVKSLFRYLGEEDPLFLAVRKAKDDLRRWESDFPGASAIPVLCQQPTFEGLTLPWILGKRKYTSRPHSANQNPSIINNYANLSSSLSFLRIFTFFDRWTSFSFISIFISNLMHRFGIGLAITASSYMLIGPILAPVANQIGMANHRHNKPLIAKAYYSLATLINVNYAEPYYNLSILCDQLNEDECASNAMQNAVWRGLPDAYAQRSRSLLLDNKHEEALKAIALCLANTQHDGVKSACFKNRGWVRLEQKQYDAAEADLRIAIGFRGDSPEAQCLLAEVLEIKGKSQAALEAWNQALKYSDYRVPEQDKCIQIAKQRLQAKGNIK
ncbi:hypothetical protein QUA81_03280 [Microcoleus sp. F6_B4]